MGIWSLALHSLIGILYRTIFIFNLYNNMCCLFCHLTRRKINLYGSIWWRKKICTRLRLIQNCGAINPSPVNFFTVSLATIYQLDIHRVGPEFCLCIICGRRWVNFCEYLGLDDWDKSERKRLTEKTKLCKISIYLRKCFLSLPERASGLYASIFVFIAD